MESKREGKSFQLSFASALSARGGVRECWYKIMEYSHAHKYVSGSMVISDVYSGQF